MRPLCARGLISAFRGFSDGSGGEILMSLLSITVVTAVYVLQLPALRTAVTVIQLSTLINDHGLLRSNGKIQVNSAATVALVQHPISPSESQDQQQWNTLLGVSQK